MTVRYGISFLGWDLCLEVNTVHVWLEIKVHALGYLYLRSVILHPRLSDKHCSPVHPSVPTHMVYLISGKLLLEKLNANANSHILDQRRCPFLESLIHVKIYFPVLQN